MKHCRALLAGLCAAACAPQEAPPAAELRISSSAPDCVLGQPFWITVERTWGAGQAPPAFDPESLQPLVLAFEGRRLEPTANWSRETSRYRAYAMTPGLLSFPPHFDLTVSSGLPVSDAGQPDAPEPVRRNAAPVAFGVLLILALAAVAGAWRGRRKLPPQPAPPPPAIALRLRELDPAAGHFPDALAAILRDWLAERSGSRARGLLAEELLARATGFSAEQRDRLGGIVKVCRAAGFGGRAWPLEERRAAQTCALAMVEEIA